MRWAISPRGCGGGRSASLRASTLSTEQLRHGQLVRARRRPHLAPGALLRILVVAEAQQPRAVAEAVALHLVVADFDDELRPHRRLLELAAAPAVRLREAALGGALHERLQPLQDLVVPAGGDGAGADVIQRSLLVVEPEQQRGERRRLRLPAHADDDAVSRLVGLDLDDALAGAGEIRQPEALADDAVEPCGIELFEPGAGFARVSCGRRDGEGQFLQHGAPLLERGLVHRLVAPEEDVEGDELRRDLRRQLADAALGWVEAHLHRVEVEPAAALDYDLAVERRVWWQQVAERPELREVAEQRPAVPAPQRELAVVVLQHAA